MSVVHIDKRSSIWSGTYLFTKRTEYRIAGYGRVPSLTEGLDDS